MTVRIRAATADDRAGIVDVFLDCWRTSYAGILSGATVAAMTDERASALWDRVLSEASSTVLVAASDAATVGVVRFATGEGVVHSLYVSPAARGLRIGTRLLDSAAESMRADGVRALALWVFAANEPAIEFYRRSGWLPDGGARTQAEFGEPELRLGRDVEGAA